MNELDHGPEDPFADWGSDRIQAAQFCDIGRIFVAFSHVEESLAGCFGWFRMEAVRRSRRRDMPYTTIEREYWDQLDTQLPAGFQDRVQKWRELMLILCPPTVYKEVETLETELLAASALRHGLAHGQPHCARWDRGHIFLSTDQDKTRFDTASRKAARKVAVGDERGKKHMNTLKRLWERFQHRRYSFEELTATALFLERAPRQLTALGWRALDGRKK